MVLMKCSQLVRIMKVTNTTTITLTADEASAILKEHFTNQGIKVDSVRFHIGEKYDEGDWRGEYPPTSFMEKVVLTATENGKEG
jgi:predicted N-formylglutamate amidohydrolase